MNRFPGWPSGRNKDLAEFRLSKSHLKHILGDNWQREPDDLDWYEGGFLIDAQLGPVVMQKYDNLSTGGTIVYVDSTVDIDVGIARLVELFEITQDDVLWRPT